MNDDRDGGPILANGFESRRAVEGGHGEIEQNDVGGLAAHLIEGFKAIAGGANDEIVGIQKVRQGVEESRIIIDDENVGFEGLAAPGQHKRKGAAFVRLALDGNRAAVQLDQFAAEIQTEADALLGGGVTFFDLVEMIEDVLLFVFWNAASVIRD